MTTSSGANAAAVTVRGADGSGDSTTVAGGVTPRSLAPAKRRRPPDAASDDGGVAGGGGGGEMAARSGAPVHCYGRTSLQLNLVTLNVAVLCNPEQDSSLRREDTTLHRCPAVVNTTRPDAPVAAAAPVGAPPQSSPTPGALPDSMRPSLGRRRVFSLIEYADYVAMSRLYGAAAGTDARFSPQFNVTELGADSRLAAMAWLAPLPADNFWLNTSLARRDGAQLAGCRDAAGYRRAPSCDRSRRIPAVTARTR